jgi:hypothetical protein
LLRDSPNRAAAMSEKTQLIEKRLTLYPIYARSFLPVAFATDGSSDLISYFILFFIFYFLQGMLEADS